jgi:hypothetical protein
MTNDHEQEEGRRKSANEMSDEELIRSVFPDEVVERIRHELHLDEENDEEHDAES